VDTEFGGYPGAGILSCGGTYAIKTKETGSFNQDTEKVSLKAVATPPE
jgi:hypothetical protein